jgi:hypothetical protein
MLRSGPSDVGEGRKVELGIENTSISINLSAFVCKKFFKVLQKSMAQHCVPIYHRIFNRFLLLLQYVIINKVLP